MDDDVYFIFSEDFLEGGGVADVGFVEGEIWVILEWFNIFLF